MIRLKKSRYLGWTGVATEEEKKVLETASCFSARAMTYGATREFKLLTSARIAKDRWFIAAELVRETTR